MQRWYFPSWCGDFRLVAAEEEAQSLLVIERPTASEAAALDAFLKVAVKRKWTDVDRVVVGEIALLLEEAAKGDGPYRGLDRQEVALRASVEIAGKELLRHVRPGKAVLTAVRSSGGMVEVSEAGDAKLEEKLKKAEKAVSVKRPTPSCPKCVPGAVGRASEVLLDFLTPQQHADWAKHRALLVTGNLSGYRYILSHRHGPVAARVGRICYDLDSQEVVTFHDVSVPPEEEVLAAKLVLEHREHWLVNEATVALWRPSFKNPFGNHLDGVVDSALTATFGNMIRTLLPR